MEMRMGWVPNRPPSSFASVGYHRLNDKVFVWVLTKEEQSVVLEDEHALFPSDTLITKVRMMGG
jgi:ethanolamine utilization protein EutQ (cupin superfamily)